MPTFRKGTRHTRVAFWSTREDEENLSHSDDYEALVEHLDNSTITCEADVRQLGDIEIYGFGRMKYDLHDLDGFAEDMVEHLEERIHESEYGSPDGDFDVLTDKAKKKLDREVRSLVRRVFREEKLEPWTCQHVATLTYSNDEVLDIVKKEWPEALGLEGLGQRLAPNTNPLTAATKG